MLGERLKKLRTDLGITQDEIATLLGIPRGTYAHYELNRRQPDNETLVKIADFFKVSTDYLLGTSDSKTPLQKWDDETLEFMEELHKRPELKILFKATSKATKDDIKKIAKMVDAWTQDDDN